MKFMQFWWCLIVLATGALGLPAYAELPPSVASALKNAGIPAQNVAVFVQAVEGSSPILSHNADKSMNPASVMKLVTTNAALDLLTPSYRWKTEVYRDGTVADGVLQGNLIIKGYGDPSFKAQDFWRMLMSVQQTGITKIQGDLVLDKSYFSQQVGPRKTFDDETWRAYNAEPSALLVNGRNTSFKFVATEAEVNVSQEFELSEIQIINRMKPAKGACGEWRSRFGYTVTQQANGAVVTFNG
ncbi:MAG TPA: D-alanyl-D-alanine carboxypeptidase, partial [Methylotenera sp.]|nr:D-alanyl-D-alanine carboxypeptidase [Methylotenera sp.]